MFLIDTNVVSEFRKIHTGKADANVTDWSNRTPASDMFLSVVTIHELEIGILRLARRDPFQAGQFRKWLTDYILPSFDGQILPVSVEVAQLSAAYHVPDPAPFRDAFIAATAHVHGLTVVTRNTSDFQRCGVPLLNPWQPH
mgnify:FL=1